MNLTWRCTTVYRPNNRALKLAFWEELQACVFTHGLPWLICGDFKAIFDVRDKNSGMPNLEDIRRANSFLNNLKL